MSAATAPLAPPSHQIEIKVAEDLALVVRASPDGVVSAALYVKSELRGSLSYACRPAADTRIEDEEDGSAVLWIGHSAAFGVPGESAAELRAFLDAARRTGGAA